MRTETINVVAEDDLVMNERLDYVQAPMAGIMGFRSWGPSSSGTARSPTGPNYWDSALIAKMISGEDYSSLVPRH